jgi:Tfp pilus assembly protein PilO
MILDNSEKKQLALTSAVTLALCVGSWMFFTSPVNTRASALQNQLDEAQSKFIDTQRKAANLPGIENDLEVIERRLRATSESLIDGDQYLWVLQNLAKYQIPDGLEFTAFDQPQEIDWGLPGADRLKATSFLVKGVGFYQELGKFTASLENDYPGLRFRAVTISPNEPRTSGKVSFVLDIVGLLSPKEPGLASEGEHLITQR